MSLVILLLSSCASTSARIQPETPPGPHLVFEEEIYEFGVAGPGEKITHTFRFANRGTEPLTITSLKTDCGCTAAIVSGKQISPGDIGEIQAVFETRQYEGRQDTRITVKSNDPARAEISLTIRGIIKREVAVVPQGIHFGDVAKGTSATARVRLLQLSKSPLILKKIQVAEQYLTVTASPFKEENSRGFNIDVALKPDVPLGTFSEVITLHTYQKRRPRIDVPVWANILGSLQVQPQALAFGTARKGERLSNALRVSSNNGSVFHVLKLACDLPFIHLRSVVAENGGIVTISALIDRLSPAGPVQGTIQIYTDDPDQKVIQVPVYGVIAK